MTDRPADGDSKPDHWQPEQYREHAAFVPALGRDLLGLLAPQSGERILDIGCGDGTLTRTLLDAGCRVTGIDASPAQIEAARALGIDAEVLDAQQLCGRGDWRGQFDAVFSNAALHWMPDHDAVLAGAHAMLRPGGRLAVECGGIGNVGCVREALHRALQSRGRDPAALDPWTFASATETSMRLARLGYDVLAVELFPRPTPLPGPLSAWLDTFAGPFLVGLDDAAASAVLADVTRDCAGTLQDAPGQWHVDYVRLRFLAQRP